MLRLYSNAIEFEMKDEEEKDEVKASAEKALSELHHYPWGQLIRIRPMFCFGKTSVWNWLWDSWRTSKLRRLWEDKSM